MKLRPTALIALAALSCVLIAPSASDQYGATAYRQLKFLLTDLSCSAPGTCDLASGTTIGGAAIGGGSGGTELNQSAGETDLRYDATQEAYYYDLDGDAAHDTDGTEDYLDLLTVEVPSDYANVQAALDSNDCKKGSTTANQGCHIRVGPGAFAEKFEISDPSSLADLQYSIVIEGAGSGGYGIGGNNLCATTFTGDGTLNHSVISVDDSIGFVLRNFCIDMNTAAANDPKYGIALGSSSASTTVIKHGIVENIAIFDQGASGGAAVLVGNNGGSIADIAFNELRNLYLDGVQTCIIVNGDQAVGNRMSNIHCVDPVATLGGVSIGSTGGEIVLEDFYFSPSIANQTGINIRNEAIGSLLMIRPTFEWDEDNGTFVNFDATGNTGAYRAATIIGGRFQPQMTATTRHVCIDWNRRGTLNVIGTSFESGNASYTCEVDLNNPDATKSSDVVWVGNDVQWAGTQAAMVINETSSGGPLRIHRVEGGSQYIGEDGSLVFEGSTLNGFETTISPTNPTADRTVTIPDANSTTVQAQTCGGTDKVSAISATGVVTCSADSGGSGGGYAEIAAAALAGF